MPETVAGCKEGSGDSLGLGSHCREFTLVREKDKMSCKCVLNHRLNMVCEGGRGLRRGVMGQFKAKRLFMHLSGWGGCLICHRVEGRTLGTWTLGAEGL